MVFSPHSEWEDNILRLIEPFVYRLHFGCTAGELRPGLSGWIYENTEVLELLAFWRAEQQTVHRSRIWRPLHQNLPHSNINPL